MFKFLSLTLLVIGLCGGAIIKDPSHSPSEEIILLELSARSDFWTKWGPGIMEFLELIDLDKIMGVFIQYLSDPEVLRFMSFVLGPKFKEVVWEFESMPEFKEAYQFLTTKGYDVEFIMDFINSGLNLPPYENPKTFQRKGKGMSGLMEDIIATLPLEDIKNLFESKLESNPELAELFDTINSEEFLDIMKRMSQNPKFTEIKDVFKSYGFDFKYICLLAQEMFGNYFQSIFCE